LRRPTQALAIECAPKKPKVKTAIPAILSASWGKSVTAAVYMGKKADLFGSAKMIKIAIFVMLAGAAVTLLPQ
jgi:hypothetical protein